MTADVFHKCCRTACINRAKYALTICVPAKDLPVFSHAPIKIQMAVYICFDHMKDVYVQDFLTEATINQTVAWCKAHGKAEPDFARAYPDALELDSPEYLKWAAAREVRK